MSLLDTSNELSTAYLNSPMPAISHSCPCTTVATHFQSSACHTSPRTRSGKAFHPVSPISDNVSFVDASIVYPVPAVASCAVVDYHVPSPSYCYIFLHTFNFNYIHWYMYQYNVYIYMNKFIIHHYFFGVANEFSKFYRIPFHF